MKATKEFIDFFNVSFGRKENLQGEIPLKEIESNIKTITDTVNSFNGDINLMDEYLQKAMASSDTTVLCALYTLLCEDIDVDKVKSVLLKYSDYLRAIREVNKIEHKRR